MSGIEEQFFYQKSRIQWLGLGDRNLRFFHRFAQSRNVRNTIRKIVTDDGRILTSPSDIKREAATHFEKFLNGTQASHIRLPQEELSDLIDHHCSSDQATKLMEPILAE